jgi:3-keto-5-aminohexanoate cleavage enzyme
LDRALNDPSDKLIITATVAPTWVYSPEIEPTVRAKWEQTTSDLVKEIYDCYEAGASIIHVHGNKPWDAEKWTSVISGVRDKCDALIQVGLSGRPMDERKELLKLKPDMCSLRLTHSDERYTSHSANILHTMDEIREYLELCNKYNVKPELESHNTGALWNARYLLERKMLELPAFLSLFFGWPGGTWTPPTLEELLYRTKLVPEGCLYQTSIMPDTVATGKDAPLHLSTLTVMIGGHVRVGSEDYAYARTGKGSKSSVEPVARIAKISGDLDREIASPSETRKMLGI